MARISPDQTRDAQEAGQCVGAKQIEKQSADKRLQYEDHWIMNLGTVRPPDVTGVKIVPAARADPTSNPTSN